MEETSERQPKNPFRGRLAFVGSGVMAEAMIKAVLRKGLVTPEQVVASGPRPERGAELRERYQVLTETDNAAAVRDADIVVLSVKPQVLPKVLPDLFARAAARAMLERGTRGRIVNMSSNCGKVGYPRMAAYCASKFGLIGFTQALAMELAPAGITVNAICPGWVLTPLVQQQIDARAKREGIPVEQAQRDLLGEKQPSLQFTTPEQLGDLAVFLCSPGADNLRGAAINVDGGWVAQ